AIRNSQSFPTRRSSDLYQVEREDEIGFRLKAGSHAQGVFTESDSAAQHIFLKDCFGGKVRKFGLQLFNLFAAYTHDQPSLAKKRDRKSTRLNSSHVKIS